ncbi:MAG: hypothetical protein FWC53_01365 [Firmicutes bacterium]|nr:hypothetical protein [Bacillota bacterium]
MEQRSISLLENRTFFSKITTTITKLLIPTKVGINGLMISIKRNSLLKAYNNYELANEIDDADKKESLYKKYEDSYALYLEAIDKYIIDSVYKKVKNGSASNFEKEALAKYYTIVSLKENQYIDYKYKKQEYLIKIDFDTINDVKKESLIEKYSKFYVSKMDLIYKGMLKNYSVQLTDKTSSKLEGLDNIYDKIFNCLETYIQDVLPIKIKLEEKEEYNNIILEYEKYQEVTIGKLDNRDIVRKKMVLLGLSRFLFTHSLPLIAAEECYIKLIKYGREILLNDSNELQRNKTYDMLVELMEDYNVKLLSTKVYWDKPEERQEYKEFWDKYKALDESDDEYTKQKKILFLKYDLHELNKKQEKYAKIVKLYKNKLVELGAMKRIKNIVGAVHCVARLTKSIKR